MVIGGPPRTFIRIYNTTQSLVCPVTTATCFGIDCAILHFRQLGKFLQRERELHMLFSESLFSLPVFFSDEGRVSH